MGQIAYLGIILSSLIGSLLYYFFRNPKYRHTHLITLFILLFVFFLEAAGEYTASRKIHNLMLYNICWVYLESFLLIYYLYKLENEKPLKKYIQLGVLSITVWGIVNSLWIQPLDTVFQFYSLLPFALLILFLAGRFLYRVLTLQVYAHSNLLAVPHFWIVIGIIFFYVEALLFFGFMNFYPDFDMEIALPWLRFNRVVAAIMYLSFGLSFYTPYLFKHEKNT